MQHFPAQAVKRDDCRHPQQLLDVGWGLDRQGFVFWGFHDEVLDWQYYKCTGFCNKTLLFLRLIACSYLIMWGAGVDMLIEKRIDEWPLTERVPPDAGGWANGRCGRIAACEIFGIIRHLYRQKRLPCISYQAY